MKTTDKKGQGLSLNFIIIAALGLIVLVIVVMIFMRESGETSDTLGSCFTQGGQCEQTDNSAAGIARGGCPENTQRMFGATCSQNGTTCCVKLSGNTA